MSKDTNNKVTNPYIPKYISTKPWYKSQGTGNDEDTLSHQRNSKDIIDFSEAKSGEGIHDDIEITETSRIRKANDYDSKRDRWFGYQSDDWSDILKNWNNIKSKMMPIADIEESDNTDYELELIELGLSKDDLKSNMKEDELERVVRDRYDIPSYLFNVSSSTNKIKFDPKSRTAQDLSGIINENNQFVSSLNGNATSLTELQRFAWEENERDQKLKQKENFTKNLENLGRLKSTNDNDNVLNLDLNIEGNPTLMEYKLKKKRQEIQESKEQKRQKILSIYGVENSSNNSHIENSDDKLVPSISVTDQLVIAVDTPARSQGQEKNASSKNSNRASYSPMTNSSDAPSINSIDSRTTDDHTNLRDSSHKPSHSHTSVFGSYYRDGKWGYKCCGQIGRNKLCN